MREIMIKRFLVSLILVFSYSSFLLAVPVHQFYNVTVPVASQEAQIRTQAIQRALQQELIKVSGNPTSILNNSVIQNAVNQANNYLLAYTYQSIINDDGSQGLGLTVAFDGKAINQLLTQAGQSVWGSNRPSVLVWLAMQQLSGTTIGSNILASTQTGPTVQKLKQDALAYGLPIILPMMDATDTQAISFNAIWQLNTAQIGQASQRYKPDAILIGKVYQNGSQWFASWLLINGSKQTTWTSQGPQLLPVLKFGISLSAQVLAANYSVPNVQTTATQQPITLTITNVNNVTDYAQAMNYLKQLPGVSQVDVVEVGTNAVTFNVTLSSSEVSFIQAISLDHRLIPSNNTAMANSAELFYQWAS